MSTKPSHRRRLGPTHIALALLSLGVLPIGAIGCGLHSVGMCDPSPLLSLVWLATLSMVGFGFAMYSLWREQGEGRIAAPILAALLNLLGWFIPLWMLAR